MKALVAAANRGGGEDNITAVAFRVSAEAAPSVEDTVAMPALDGDEPDEQTREYLEEEPEEEPAAEAVEAGPVARRVRLVLIVLVLLAIAAALVVWRLVL